MRNSPERECRTFDDKWEIIDVCAYHLLEIYFPCASLNEVCLFD